MSKVFSAEDRRRIASRHGLNERYLYQCLTGRREMEAAQARELEEATGGELRRWHLRTKDWHRIWPDLIGTTGAPDLPADEVRDAACQ